MSQKRGIHQGCPLSVMAFLIPSLISDACPGVELIIFAGVELIIFADDVTLVSDPVGEIERAAQLIAGCYRDSHITLNPQKTQLWSAQGGGVSIVLEGVQIESKRRIQLLRVEYADSTGDMIARNDGPGA